MCWRNPFCTPTKQLKEHAVKEENYKTLTKLGGQSTLPSSPDEASLEFVVNPHSDRKYLIRFTCPEFTSLCPVTGQPDFACFIIDYIPEKTIVESKSLKLYLNSFRNYAAFHEDCTVKIAKRLTREMEPHWLRIGGYWYPRGGIPIDIFYQTGEPPSAVWLPPQEISIYSGRKN
ncbi:MAG: NADPH-dependent 7-cyano-7-deazaguanine reductase QueF [Magnetovibrio sp.]|nr:NADPH-dependent 7-cyano-7-deazaguanine reductase QueF [Magnetovibrio sp.]